MNAHDTVSTEIAAQLVVPGSPSLPLVSAVRYDPCDPYAVHVQFVTGVDEVVEWTFARHLLTEGVTHQVGEGDVRVWPATADGRAVVCLALTSPGGRALFEFPLADVVEFLTSTYTLVPSGAESSFFDIDAELAVLLWGEGA